MFFYLLGSVPSTPYTTNEKGQGPAWANSLFEDFCEFGLGMELANEKMRKRLEGLLQQITVGEHAPAEAKEIAAAWIANQNDAEKTKELAPQVMAFVEQGIKEGLSGLRSDQGIVSLLGKTFSMDYRW